MSKANYLGKPLKGLSSVLPGLLGPITSSVVSSIANGGVLLGNVIITSGTIDNTTIGSNGIGPVYTSILQSGSPLGDGYGVYFYGSNIGDYATWDPNIGEWNIQGSLNVRDMTDLGNIRINGNTISSTNTNGPININPNGSGIISINAPITQTTSNGNVSFSTTIGTFAATSFSNASLSSTNGSIALTAGKGITQQTANGDITLQTGTNIPITNVSSISTGTNTLQITTTTDNNYTVGQQLQFSRTNSTPELLGNYTVSSIINNRLFTITVKTPGTAIGNTGSVHPTNSIFLTATNYVNIPYNVPLNFGSTCDQIVADTNNNLSISSCGVINILPATSINVPTGIPLNFGTQNSISSNAGILTIAGNTTISGNFTVTGSQTVINTQQVYSQDPLITLGASGSVSTSTINDTMDRGIAYYYGTGTTAATGYFGWRRTTNTFVYIPVATISNNIVSGAIGNAEFENLSVNSLVVNSTGGSGVTLGILTGNPDITLNERNLFLNATGYISIPNNIKLKFGSGATKVYEDIFGNLQIASTGTTVFNSNVVIPTSTTLNFNGDINSTSKIVSISGNDLTLAAVSVINLNTLSIQLIQTSPILFSTDTKSKILADTSGNLQISAGNNINLNSSTIVLPSVCTLNFGTSSNSVSNTPTGLSVISNSTVSLTSTSGSILLTPATNVVLPVTKGLIFGNNTENITSTATSSGNNIVVSAAGNITLAPTSNVLIQGGKCLLFGSTTETICPVSGNLNVSASQNINLNPIGYVGITLGKTLQWNIGLGITGSVGTGLTISSTSGLYLTASTAVIIPVTVPVQYGATTEIVVSDNSNNLNVSALRNIVLNPGGAVFTNKSIQFSSTTETISGNNGALQLTAGSEIDIISSSLMVSCLNIKFTDPILSVGGLFNLTSDTLQDKGIDFYWNTSSIVSPSTSRQGFFGFKRSTGVFTFIPNGTNTGEIYTGTPGPVLFGNITGASGFLTGMDLASGSLTNVNVIENTASISFNVPAASSIIVPNNVNLQIGSSNTNTISSDGTNLTVSSNTGTFNVLPNSHFSQNVQIDGTLTVSGNIPVYNTIEYVTCPAGETTSIDWTKKISFITVTGTGTAIIVSSPSPAGLFKTIIVSNLVAGTSTLSINFNGISRFKNPGNGDVSSNGVMTFDTPGQSITLVYDTINGYFLNPQGGCYFS